jgi:hypothetical protein
MGSFLKHSRSGVRPEGNEECDEIGTWVMNIYNDRSIDCLGRVSVYIKR